MATVVATAVDPSRLEAFADGALSPEEAAALVLHLADHPADQAYVDRLLECNVLLAAAYGAPMCEPVPELIRAAIWPGAGVRPPRQIREILTRIGPALGGALAAMVVLFLGLWLRPDPDGPGQVAGPIPADTPLHAALETHESGAVETVGVQDAITLVATFWVREHQPCREFELLHSVEQSLTRGIACRADSAEWSVAVAVSEPVVAPEPSRLYVPAEGAASSALAHTLDNLQASISLSPAEERALIRNRWQF